VGAGAVTDGSSKRTLASAGSNSLSKKTKKGDKQTSKKVTSPLSGGTGDGTTASTKTTNAVAAAATNAAHASSSTSVEIGSVVAGEHGNEAEGEVL
jgi:hypothetical protein